MGRIRSRVSLERIYATLSAHAHETCFIQTPNSNASRRPNLCSLSSVSPWIYKDPHPLQRRSPASITLACPLLTTFECSNRFPKILRDARSYACSRPPATSEQQSPSSANRHRMDDRQHKAHRPAQSGAKAEKKKGKGKEKQKGFNEKVRLRSASLHVA